jgi:hypothetical protein
MDEIWNNKCFFNERVKDMSLERKRRRKNPGPEA